MTNAELGHRQANRRLGLNLAGQYLRDIGTVFPDYAAWVEEVTALADRLLPWLDSDCALRAEKYRQQTEEQVTTP